MNDYLTADSPGAFTRLAENQMKKLLLTIALAVIATGAYADAFRVHYTIQRNGSGHEITIQADNYYEAKVTVESMFPGSYVTNVRRLNYGRHN